jgi:hypothetical protein
MHIFDFAYHYVNRAQRAAVQLLTKTQQKIADAWTRIQDDLEDPTTSLYQLRDKICCRRNAPADLDDEEPLSEEELSHTPRLYHPPPNVYSTLPVEIVQLLSYTYWG